MYRPKQFDVIEIPEMHRLIRENGFATLVNQGPDGLIATHAPLHLTDETGNGVLWGHIARANDQWQAFDGTAETLAVFAGPHSYISPTWYTTEKSVPTWNYEAVHAYGRPRIMDDPEAVLALLSELSDQYESGRDAPWRLAGLPKVFVAARLKHIVAFEMRIERLEGKRKMSQNRKPEDVKGAMSGLRATGRPDAAAVADIMAEANKDRL
ncbi:MAG: transcriptional regulator [Rhodospirillales bacterium CG15_BIG_FIL_POST_REV_8_21_14_020_66_15]|nr:MAG: transcriptional regulator [Rhodospirillales bacterium CG15_BIG_FIL_POST_REV_8_21_14_020_66_15]